MKFMNPYPTTCEHCNHKSNYPVNALLEFTSVCVKCNTAIRKTALAMHQTKREHSITMWPILFIFDALDVFDIDIDHISDEEYDNMETMDDFIILAKRIGNNTNDIEARIIDMDIIKPIKDSLEPASLAPT